MRRRSHNSVQEVASSMSACQLMSACTSELAAELIGASLVGRTRSTDVDCLTTCLTLQHYMSHQSHSVCARGLRVHTADTHQCRTCTRAGRRTHSNENERFSAATLCCRVIGSTCLFRLKQGGGNVHGVERVGCYASIVYS